MLENLHLPKEVIQLFQTHGTVLHYKKGDLLQKCDCYNTGVCIIIKGIVKVSVQSDNKKIFLYHINGKQPNMINYSGIYSKENSDICCICLDDVTILRMTNHQFLEWVNAFSEFRALMIASFHKHYTSILERTQNTSDQPLKTILYNYLKVKVDLYNTNEVKVPLLEISEDLNFSREAISRGLKTLESENRIIRKTRSIIVLEQSIAS
ncbi:transcriptional regulator, Crp/Fnr family [Tenacibaculum sp. 190524A02b]|uniref:Crp/Fnr family transcriptional regulator n=1 Tax=Tenacibaculum vairaonense TaxID=3137860 RepID=UPI0032B25C0F